LPLNASIASFQRRFEVFVRSPDFPCVGARSAINSGRAGFGLYRGLGARGDIAALCDDLGRFSLRFPDPCEPPASFIAMFDDSVADEEEFEHRLWQHLQDLHAHDRGAFDWDPRVSSDPASRDFSFSVGGRAFFVVGLHPAASRVARQAPMPCLVFNFHEQFEALRASGGYTRMERVIRERDLSLQGDLNPMLDGFGESSEARQYSGRAHDADWRCPFNPGDRHAD
jgi:FPC/CPF motif-containing protein YcgG